MTLETGETRPQEVPAPRRHEGNLSCPRCESRLLSNGWNLFCLACGYEYGQARFMEAEYRALMSQGAPSGSVGRDG